MAEIPAPTFTIVVHVATVLSTLVILWKEIDWIFRGLFKWQLKGHLAYGMFTDNGWQESFVSAGDYIAKYDKEVEAGNM